MDTATSAAGAHAEAASERPAPADTAAPEPASAPAPSLPAPRPRPATTAAAPPGATLGGRSPLATGLWGRAEQQDFRSRVRGTLLGSALGDALGAPVAGLSPDAIREAHGPHGLIDPAPAHGRRGAITSVTQLTLFTVDGLIRAHVRRDTGAWHPPTDVHRAYLRWAATQHDWGPDERRKDNGWLAGQEWLYARRDPDRNCLTGFADTVLGTLANPKNPAARDAAAPARSAPFGLLIGWEPALVLQLAVECAAQSHGHPTAYLAAGAFAVIVHGLTRGDTPDSAVQRALGLLGSRPGHQPVTDALQHAVAAAAAGTRPTPGPSTGAPDAAAPNTTGPDGTTPNAAAPADTGLDTAPDAAATLATAVHCALAATDVPNGLRLAVNLGGNSTAAGAMCGALLGALHGETALPAAWLADLEGRATLLELADDFALEMTQGPALHTPTTAAPGWLARYPRA
ncbi:ADP-ribosylglycohydrolase family protein [Streptomyces sp. NPDC046876]|uniref:ADP-ribosylglycohydrolase family protein n=1 Tax=Streptomyces sp. NPDC046876 TaxID=3155616 RepID=UPI003407648B